MPATKGVPGETPEPTTPTSDATSRTDAGTSSASGATAASAGTKGGRVTGRPAAVGTKNLPPRARRKAEAQDQAARRRAAREAGIVEPSPRWWAPLMVTLMIIGLLWVVLYYVSSGHLLVPALGAWNLLAGFAFMIVGFLMTTRWR